MSRGGTPLSAGWAPILTALGIWFAHFMLCWLAVEFWADPGRANALAWVFTAIALTALGAHYRRVERSAAHGEVADFNRRFARGAIAIATVAIMFTALPSIVIRP